MQIAKLSEARRLLVEILEKVDAYLARQGGEPN
jgi:hypothetical protein